MSDLSTSRLIRVLHVCTILLTARVFIAPLARHLASRGYDVAVACSDAEAADGPTVFTAPVPAAAPTLYARTGDVFLAACAAAVIVGTGRALFRRA